MTVPIYSQFTFGSSTNQITFNDESGDYIFKARRRLAQNREIRQYDTNVPNEPGIVDYQTLPGREYYVIEGTLYGIDENALYRGMEALRKATSPAVTQDDPYSDSGYLPLKWSENVDKQLMLKPLYVDIAETRKSAMKPAFKILFKIKYPFIQSHELHAQSLTPTTTAGTGIQIPSTGLQIPTGGIGIGADSGTGGGTVVNNGDYKTYPILTITGPINNPKITNTTTGKYIEFTYNLTSGTATISIDNEGVVAETSGGVNLLQYLTATSDLLNFCLEEGGNNITLTASSMGTGADLTISYRDSWPL